MAGKHTKVIFVTGGPDDGMRLSYNDKLYEGSALCSEAAEFGQMVSVVLDCVPDVRTTMLTVAVPEGHRPSDMRSIGIHTFAVITTTKTSVSGSPLVSGQIREYEVVLLHGNAW